MVPPSATKPHPTLLLAVVKSITKVFFSAVTVDLIVVARPLRSINVTPLSVGFAVKVHPETRTDDPQAADDERALNLQPVLGLKGKGIGEVR